MLRVCLAPWCHQLSLLEQHASHLLAALLRSVAHYHVCSRVRELSCRNNKDVVSRRRDYCLS